MIVKRGNRENSYYSANEQFHDELSGEEVIDGAICLVARLLPPAKGLTPIRATCQLRY